MLNVTSKAGFGGVDDAAPTQSFLQQTRTVASTATFSFAGQNLGAEHPERFILVALVCQVGSGTPTINSVTVAGTSATAIVSLDNGTRRVAIYLAKVPTGTSGTIEVALSATGSACTIDVYRIANLTSVAALATSSGTSDPQDLSLLTANQGIVIGAAQSASGAATFSWTGLTENSDSGNHFSTASALATAYEGSRSVSVDFTGSISLPIAVCASFR